MKYKRFDKTFSDITSMEYIDVIKYIMSTIPKHDSELSYDEMVDLLGYYSALYTTLSEHMLLFSYLKDAKKKNESYHLYKAYDQILKDIKFLYDSLSRKITVMSNDQAIVTSGRII